MQSFAERALTTRALTTSGEQAGPLPLSPAQAAVVSNARFSAAQGQDRLTDGMQSMLSELMQ